MLNIGHHWSIHLHRGPFREGTAAELAVRVRHALKGEGLAPGRPTGQLLRLVEISSKTAQQRRIVHAADCGDAVKLIQALKRTGPEHPMGETPLLFRAISSGDLDSVQALLEDGRCDVNEPDPRTGRRPIDEAAWMGRVDMVDALLTRGADPTPTTQRSGRSPVMVAAERGHGDVVRRLLQDERVDPNARDVYGLTALHAAANNGHAAAVIALREDPRTEVDALADGKTPAMFAARRDHVAALKALLLPAGARPMQAATAGLPTPPSDLTRLSSSGHSILVQAVAADAVSAVAWLAQRLDGGAINRPDGFGAAPIHHAAMKGNTEVVQALLRHPDIDLDVATRSLEAAHRLLAHGTFHQRVALLTEMARRHGAQALAPLAKLYVEEWPQALEQALDAGRWRSAERLIEAATLNDDTQHFPLGDARLRSLFESQTPSDTVASAVRTLIAHAGEPDLQRLVVDEEDSPQALASKQAYAQALFELPPQMLARRLAAITMAGAFDATLGWADGSPIDVLFSLVGRSDAQQVAQSALQMLEAVNGRGIDGAAEGAYRLRAETGNNVRTLFLSKLMGRLEAAANAEPV
jgi:ankyrin repeat protein